MIKKEIKYTYRDLSILPALVSDIKSRKECDVFDEDGNLPIFTAPMDSVVSEDNLSKWIENKVIPIIPRNISYEQRKEYLQQGYWVALSLCEYEELFCNVSDWDTTLTYRALIDVANGHMQQIFDLVKQSREIWGNHLVIMAGNIANPDTYRLYCKAGIDYVRCGIGGGSACLTTSNTSVHMPLASLLEDIYEIKKQREPLSFCTKIIADGGIKNYSDAIKALALGADYVMIGGIFAGLWESASEMEGIDWDSENNGHILTPNGALNIGKMPSTEEEKREFIKKYGNFLFKSYHGMSTKEAQKAINSNAKNFKTSEGKTISRNLSGTLQQWTENFSDYLKSAMSYTNKRSLNEFCGKVELIVNSYNVIQTVNS